MVALVLPKRSASLQSIVNMRLLRRSADTADKNVVLITKEAALLPLAGAAGLHVAESLQGRPEVPPSPRPGAPAAKPGDIPVSEEADIDEDNAKLDYHRSIGELAEPDEEAEEISLADEDKEEEAGKPAKKSKAAKVKIPNFDRFRLILGLGILFVILLIVFVVLAIVVLPKATITIQTSSTPISTSFNLTTSDSAKALDETNSIIPAVLKSSDFTSNQTVQATGQQNNGTKATGTVTVSTVCTVPPPSVGPGVGLVSSGLVFVTTDTLDLSNIAISGGHFVCSGDVPVKAQQGGKQYNLAAGSIFTVQGYSSYSGTNANNLTGGTDNIVTVVSQADLDNAKNKVSSTDTDNFSKNFQSDLTNSGLYLIPSTFKAADPVVTSTPALGQPATSVTVTIKITYSVLTVQKSDLQKIITDKLQSQIKQSEQRISGDVVQGAAVSVQSQSSPTVAVLSIDENTTAVPILNVNSIKQQSAGKKSGDISNVINALPGVKGVTVKLSPFWVSKAPKAGKITVVQQQVKSGS